MTVKMPRAADTVDEVMVAEWVAPLGATIEVGDALIRVETDKALVEVPCPVSGVLVEQLVAPDDEISTGAPIAIVESS